MHLIVIDNRQSICAHAFLLAIVEAHDEAAVGGCGGEHRAEEPRGLAVYLEGSAHAPPDLERRLVAAAAARWRGGLLLGNVVRSCPELRPF